MTERYDKSAYWSQYKYKVHTHRVRFELNLYFCADFIKYNNINLMKTIPVAAMLFHAEGRTDGQTDRHGEGNSRILQFCELA